MSNEKRYIFGLIFGKTASRAVNLIVILLFEIKNRRKYKKIHGKQLSIISTSGTMSP